MMIKGKTKSGFSYHIKETALDNMELIEIIAEVDDEPLLVPKLVKMLLGEEQKKKLYDHIRLDDGTVPSMALAEEIAEIFNGSKKTKN